MTGPSKAALRRIIAEIRGLTEQDRNHCRYNTLGDRLIEVLDRHGYEITKKEETRDVRAKADAQRPEQGRLV